MRRRKTKRLAKLKKIFSNPLNFREPKKRSYLIKIDRKTIRENPKAGDMQDHAYISTTGYISIMVKHESLEKEDDRIRMISRSSSITKDEKFVEKVDYIVGGMDFVGMQELADKLRKRFGKHFTFTFENHFQEINLMPGSYAPFLYEYKKTLVKCMYCDSRFDHTLLKSDGDEDGDGNYYSSDAICPKCGEWECCTVEYEDIGGIILSKMGLPSLVVG